jgi:predicted DNA-binding transcriptional regulator AlpA
MAPSSRAQRQSRKRQRRPKVPLPRAVYDIADCLARLGIGKTSFCELRKTGRFPEPDVCMGTTPRWRAATVEDWITSGGASGPNAKCPLRPDAKSGSSIG